MYSAGHTHIYIEKSPVEFTRRAHYARLHKDYTDRFDLVDAVNDFRAGNEHRRVSEFKESDL